jgi:hypothetical protein
MLRLARVIVGGEIKVFKVGDRALGGRWSTGTRQLAIA